MTMVAARSVVVFKNHVLSCERRQQANRIRTAIGQAKEKRTRSRRVYGRSRRSMYGVIPKAF